MSAWVRGGSLSLVLLLSGLAVAAGFRVALRDVRQVVKCYICLVDLEDRSTAFPSLWFGWIEVQLTTLGKYQALTPL